MKRSRHNDADRVNTITQRLDLFEHLAVNLTRDTLRSRGIDIDHANQSHIWHATVDSSVNRTKVPDSNDTDFNFF